MVDVAIDCRHLSKTFFQRTIPIDRLQDRILGWHLRGRQVRIDALKDVSLSVERGEWVGLYGPNGSGKTTLLKVIAGLLRPDSGTVRTRGELSSFFELGIGFHPERQARENVRLHALLRGCSPREIQRTTERVLAFADIGAHAELPLKCYSTGMHLRLAFAASIQADADTYLIDEVLTVGDAAFQQKCLAHFALLKEQGKTVVLVSHDRGMLEQWCHRIVTFDRGRIMHFLK